MTDPLPTAKTDVLNAACYRAGAHLPFIALEEEEENQTTRRDYAIQIRMCQACPERLHCAEDAVTFRDQSTIRAGFRTWLPQERRNLVQYLRTARRAQTKHQPRLPKETT